MHQISQESSSLYNESFWKNLYEILRKPVTSFVRRSKLPSWVGQEDDIVNDIIQETVMRVYKKFLAAPDEVFSIQSMEAFAYTIAYRYFLDLLRKKKRISHLPRDLYGFEMSTTAVSDDDGLNMFLEAMTILSVLTDAAHIIAKIPNKQRRALLVDLARYNDFTEEPTLMEQAFAKVGIQLRDYCQLLSLDDSERSRHNALVSSGYRRLRKTMSSERADGETNVLSAMEEQASVELVPDGNFKIKDEKDRILSTMFAQINELREPYRNAVRLHYMERYSYPKIAEYLHLPIGTVKSHVSRGKKMLENLAVQKAQETLKTDEESQGEMLQITKNEMAAYTGGLREPYRSAIRLHCLEEHSYPKTAEHLQLPVGTVKSLVSRGKKMLLGMHKEHAV